MKKKFSALMAVLCVVFSLSVFCGPLSASAEEPFGSTGEYLLQEENSIIEVPVVVFNNTGVDIYYLYMSPSSSSSWGNDMLGSMVLDDGEYFETSIVVDRTDTEWDFKIEDLEGTELTWKEIDIGEMPSSGFGIEFTISEGDAYLKLIEDEDDLSGYYR